MLDADGDGTLSWQELNKAIKRCRQTGEHLRRVSTGASGTDIDGLSILTRLSAMVAQHGGKVKEVFAQFDTDDSGLLDNEEVLKMIKKLVPGASKAELRLVMKHLSDADANDDGELSLAVSCNACPPS